MWRLFMVLRLLLRLWGKYGSHGGQTQGLDQVTGLTRLTYSCQWRLVRLLRVRLLVSRLASLGLLHLTSGQLHVGIPHHLPVQLILGPQQHPHADRQLALGGLGVLGLQYGGIQLTGNLNRSFILLKLVLNN